jgi:hypothetical protein
MRLTINETGGIAEDDATLLARCQAHAAREAAIIDADYILGRYYRVWGGSVQVVGHHPATETDVERIGVRCLKTQIVSLISAACWRELIQADAIIDD